MIDFCIAVSPSTVPMDTSLNTYIRNYVKLSGTKFMCLEGGCGSCVVTLEGIHPANKTKTTWAINSVRLETIKYLHYYMT